MSCHFMSTQSGKAKQQNTFLIRAECSDTLNKCDENRNKREAERKGEVK